MSEKVEIDKEEYEELLSDSKFLDALFCNGRGQLVRIRRSTEHDGGLKWV